MSYGPGRYSLPEGYTLEVSYFKDESTGILDYKIYDSKGRIEIGTITDQKIDDWQYKTFGKVIYKSQDFD